MCEVQVVCRGGVGGGEGQGVYRLQAASLHKLECL